MKVIFEFFRRHAFLEVVAGISQGFVIGMAILAAIHFSASNGGLRSARAAVAPASTIESADFGSAQPSKNARLIADWVAQSHDAGGASFVIVDKKEAEVYVFDEHARLLGASPVLLGFAPGDDTAPGVGSMLLNEVTPDLRTTPAGRFLGEKGHDERGEDVVWVDYDAGVSMHRVLTTNPAERRLERLATPTNEDNRISYGCINVPVAFYESYIRPAFATHKALVYVLPEVKTLEQAFPQYEPSAIRHSPVTAFK